MPPGDGLSGAGIAVSAIMRWIDIRHQRRVFSSSIPESLLPG
ncbi:hypothetical protein [Streptosporangium sp. KLBMP 9127]